MTTRRPLPTVLLAVVLLGGGVVAWRVWDAPAPSPAGRRPPESARIGRAGPQALDRPGPDDPDAVMVEVTGVRYRVRRADWDRRGPAAIHRDLFLQRLRGLTSAGDPEPAACLALARWADAQSLPDLYGLALRWTLLLDSEHAEARRLLTALRARLRALPARPAAAARLQREMAATDPSGGAFRLHRTPHFRIVHQVPERFAEDTGALLERVHGAFFRFFRRRHFEPVPPADRLEVVIFASQEVYRRFVAPFGPALQSSAGVYSGKHHRSYFYDALTDPRRREAHRRMAAARASLDRLEGELLAGAAPDDTFRVDTGEGPPRELTTAEARAVLRRQRARLARASANLERRYEGLNVARAVHEITHHLAYAAGIHPRHHPSPRWLVEGLAQYFEVTEGAWWPGPGGVDPARLARVQGRIRQGTTLSLDRLVASDAPFEAGGALAIEAYDAAWAFFYFLAETRHDALFDYLANLSLRVAAEPETAAERRRDLTRALGPLPPLEREWLRYLDGLRPTAPRP